MSRIVLIVAALLLAGCDPDKERRESPDATLVDQCLRAELFRACLSSVPRGPDTTKYNDWAEVVEECGAQAYRQALRARKHVEEKCRAGRLER